MNETTKEFYNKNCSDYFHKTKDVVLLEPISYFLSYVKTDDIILDLGCGSGNNLKHFVDKGYNAIGIDFSERLCTLAEEYSKTKVFCLDFSNYAKLNDFILNNNVKHIFAAASLLHLSKKQFKIFFENIDIDGVIFFSLKEGYGEKIHNDGRFFSFYTKEEVENILKQRFKILHFFRDKDILKRDIFWLSWIVKSRA